ncbi:MAG: phosphopantothenoylcysteine decarboxylase/phosphopantothenate--cysteine ligase [Myxococcota bacterium]|jgi:phosphopantothenoylcysteine decarboxylase/phosphopantothenate--cysteine ligase
MARFLVTAGPTREAIDPVRFLSNRSSGKMGYAICEALVTAGHEVLLVSGPTCLPVPIGVEAVQVESAWQMLEACQKSWSSCDALIAVAAVSDYRPSKTQQQKIKSSSEVLTIELEANPDIVKTLAATKGKRLVVGFALESENGEGYARKKLDSKGLDLICLNAPSAQGADASQLLILSPTSRYPLGPCAKSVLATELVEYILTNNDV